MNAPVQLAGDDGGTNHGQSLRERCRKFFVGVEHVRPTSNQIWAMTCKGPAVMAGPF